MDQASELSMRQRVSFWVAAWGIACLATLTAFGSELWLVKNTPWPVVFGRGWVCFPYGFLFIFVDRDPVTGGHYLGYLVVGWLLYLGLTIFGLAQRKRARFFVSFGILCALLAFNVVGCHVQAYNQLNPSGTGIPLRPPSTRSMMRRVTSSTFTERTSISGCSVAHWGRWMPGPAEFIEKSESKKTSEVFETSEVLE